MADAWERFIIDIDEAKGLYNLFLDIRETIAKIVRDTPVQAAKTEFMAIGKKVQDIQQQFAAELDTLAVVTAQSADRLIVNDLRGKIVRPPTGGRPGLANSVQSVAAPTGAFSFAQVEVALVEKLNQAVNPDGASAKPYWRAQEYGSSKMVGRSIQGLFFGAGGDAVPNPLQFRVHPLFLPGAGGKGTISRAIPAKHFLRDGTDMAKDIWRARVREIVARAVAQINAIQVPAIP